MSSCTTVAAEQWFLDLTMLISSRRDIWTRTVLVQFWQSVLAFTSSRTVFQCVLPPPPARRSPPSPATNGCLGLCCTPVNLTHRVLLPRETQVNHLPHHTNGGNAEFPAVAADPNQATLFPSTRFPPIARADYRHSSSVFTMAVNMKGVVLSGGNQCQMEPLHALVHSHPLLNNDCLIPLSPHSRLARKTRSAREYRTAASSNAPKIMLLIFDSLLNMWVHS